ncbi:MAG: cyclic nucleotide-binding protein [Alkaliphilus sp.]|nr:Crp/Fnr family transcriptional regulator [bacterium AH-315-G05]PHS30866.1 MAG: cyclic nucleotide-binding protein [Alkaliphilus sp.]
MNQIINMLSYSTFFRGKASADIERTLSTIDYFIKSYKPGELIFGVTQKTEHIGIILTGSIEVQKNLASGNIVTLLSKGKGELFGEGSVFSDSLSYPSDIFCKEPSTILHISKENVLALISIDSVLLGNFLNSLANRVLMLNLKTELLSYQSIQKKIAFSLLYLMNEFRNGDTIELPYSKKSWSEYLNTSRPSLSRELKVLTQRGILSLSNRKIKIISNAALLSILHD